ncbi:carbamoyltransferase HypF [Thermogladius sp.]|uniref:carbamoyltransferase HypF n=1 Tax=Thermogladius sp. TaxID=2023064 RepID=UPI003D136C14
MRAKKIVVVGLVQGVGFRPFIDRLARRLRVAGYVRNVGGSEVEIWVEGEEGVLEEFVKRLVSERPPPAFIEELRVEDVEPEGYSGFTIKPSGYDFKARSNIPPDLAMCHDCLLEVLNPEDRRYGYPFNSCAWCGPRFSMIYRVPYDRENTSMRKYQLCGECTLEYRDPENLRRYHAQGISCPRDGPRLLLLDRNGSVVDEKSPIETAAKLVEEGGIVAVKGIGGFHLAALATNDDVVAKLRARKRRPRKPFAIMGIDTVVLRRLVYITEEDEELLNSPQAPILLLPKREDTPVSPLVSPGLSHEGVFVAYTPLHYLLLRATRDKFLIMTSGNVSGEPMCKSEECAFRELKNVADYFLVHDREVVHRVDDSVVRKTNGRYVLLRRSRGYAPLWIRLPQRLRRNVVAFGGDLNNTIAVGFEDKVVVSPYVGDLDEVETVSELRGYLEFLVASYRVSREDLVVVSDKHPGYVSTALAREYSRETGARLVTVQHHLSHVLSVVGDHRLNGRVAGLAIDGLGWGDDGTIWGGEVIVVDTERGLYQRVASIRPVPLTGDTDTLRPLRVFAGLMTLRGYSEGELLRVLRRIGVGEREYSELLLVRRLVEKGLYRPASSTGRLIDVVSAVLGVCRERSYEGEPAIRLEAEAFKGEYADPPEVRLYEENGVLRLDTWSYVEWLLDKLDEPRPAIARTFLESLGENLGRLLVESTRGLGVGSEVAVSGGAAVNEFIVRGLERVLREEGLKLLLPSRVPPNDEGVSFGQVVYCLFSEECG